MTTLLTIGVGLVFLAYMAVYGRARLRSLTLASLFVLPFLPAWAGIQLGSSSSTPLINLSKMVFLGLALAWFVRRPELRARRSPIGRKWRGSIVVLLALQTASLLVTTSMTWSILTLGAYAVYYYFIYLCVYDVVDSTATARRLMLVLAVAGSITAVLGVYEAATGLNLWRGANAASPSLMRYGFIRASGAFGSYLSLGAFLALVWPLWFAVRARTPRARMAVFAAAVFGLAATWATVSRGPIMGGLAAAVLGLVLMSGRGRIRLLVVAAVAAALLSFAAPRTMSAIVRGTNVVVKDTLSPTKDVDAYARVATMKNDLRLIAGAPALGYGVGAASRTYVTGNTQLAGVRGEFTTIALESGLGALAALLFLLLGSLALFSRRALRSSDSELRRLYFALSLSLTAAIVSLMTINVPEPVTYLFALLAVGHRLHELENVPETEHTTEEQRVTSGTWGYPRPEPALDGLRHRPGV